MSPDVRLILDNARIHHSEQTQEAYETLKEARGTRVRFMSPYSPFLSCCEYFFHRTKDYLRDHPPQNVEDLMDKLRQYCLSVQAGTGGTEDV
ncbi:MAG: transposase, partial [Hydrogenophaga sp.]